MAVFDYLHKEFTDVPTMCSFYNVKVPTFYTRRWKGWTLKECLLGRDKSQRTYKHSTPRRDHNNNEYDTDREMCEAYNIPPKRFYRRRYLGWDLKTSLLGKTYKDFAGNSYSSVDELCKATGIKKSTYYGKTKMQRDTRTPVKQYKCADHTGVPFKNEKEMAFAWNIDYDVYMARKHRDWSLKRCLTTPVRKFKKSAQNS